MPTNNLATFVKNGRLTTEIVKKLVIFAQTHPRLETIEDQAQHLISQAGGTPAFSKVPGYHWATCISVNDVIVHGIPRGTIRPGDLVTIDTGMSYHDTTTDMATTFRLGDPELFTDPFLAVGLKTLKKTLDQVRSGAKIRALSKAMQTTIEKAGYNVTRNLTGHGLGKTMHEEPPIPCFTSDDPALAYTLKQNQVLAIEVMYMKGDWALKIDRDGWTMRTQDGSDAAVFEVDIAVTQHGCRLLAGYPLEPD